LVTEANNKDAELHTAVERIKSICDYEFLFSSHDCEREAANVTIQFSVTEKWPKFTVKVREKKTVKQALEAHSVVRHRGSLIFKKKSVNRWQRKRRSLGRYSSLSDSGHGVFLKDGSEVFRFTRQPATVCPQEDS
jgi:hypothetical protein